MSSKSTVVVSFVSLVALAAFFQNCSSGGTLSLESSSLKSSAAIDKLLGSCLAANRTCDERYSTNAADQAAFQSSCTGSYDVGACLATADRLGVCEEVISGQKRDESFYSGYSGTGASVADETAMARQNCTANQGLWKAP